MSLNDILIFEGVDEVFAVVAGVVDVFADTDNFERIVWQGPQDIISLALGEF